MDNLGPIALFVIYMAISAWAKKNKAQRRARQEAPQAENTPPPENFMGGIFEQLKQEFLESEEEPVPYVEMVPTPVVETVVEKKPSPSFVEGISSIPDKPHQGPAVLTADYSQQSLESMLEPYTSLEQGILLHEILGKPRAYQQNDEWFHKS